MGALSHSYVGSTSVLPDNEEGGRKKNVEKRKKVDKGRKKLEKERKRGGKKEKK